MRSRSRSFHKTPVFKMFTPLRELGSLRNSPCKLLMSCGREGAGHVSRIHRKSLEIDRPQAGGKTRWPLCRRVPQRMAGHGARRAAANFGFTRPDLCGLLRDRAAALDLPQDAGGDAHGLAIDLLSCGVRHAAKQRSPASVGTRTLGFGRRRQRSLELAEPRVSQPLPLKRNPI